MIGAWEQEEPGRYAARLAKTHLPPTCKRRNPTSLRTIKTGVARTIPVMDVDCGTTLRVVICDAERRTTWKQNLRKNIP